MTAVGHFVNTVGVVGGGDDCVSDDRGVGAFCEGERGEAIGEDVPVVLGGDLVGDNVSEEAALHPVVDEPAPPVDFVCDLVVPPGEEELFWRTLPVEVVLKPEDVGVAVAVLQIPDDAVVLHESRADISHNQDGLIC